MLRALSSARRVAHDRSGLRARPTAILGVAAVAGVAAFQLWITPSNPPGFIRDEASLAYNAYTISQDLRDQDGGLLPLYFTSFADYKSPVFVYALAAVFRVTGPDAEVARGLAAVFVLGAVLLLGLLAFRRSRSAVAAAAIVVLAGTTPWLFEVGRVAFEVSLEPLVICVLLLVLDRAWRSYGATVLNAIAAGLTLGLLTYVYAAGRLLGPLFAAALVVFARRDRRWWVATAWATYAVTLLPLAAYWHRHPGALTARFERTTFIHDGMSLPSIVRTAVSNYVHDANLWYWVTSGDPKPYVHTWGAGSLFAAVVLLALAGAAVVLLRKRGDLWWRYVLVITLLSPIPAALTEDRFYALRLVQLAVLLLVLAVPGLVALLDAARHGWVARGAVAVLAAVTVVQFAHFVDVYTTVGPRRVELFEAGVPGLLEQAFARGSTVYVDFDDRYAQTHMLWYAVSHGIPRARVQILPDGGIPPSGSMVFGRYQTCDYVCNELGRSYSYWIAKAVGPKPS